MLIRPISDVEFVQSVLLYADDVTLLAPSVFALQVMVGICAAELEFLDMAINMKKSSCLRFTCMFVFFSFFLRCYHYLVNRPKDVYKA